MRWSKLAQNTKHPPVFKCHQTGSHQQRHKQSTAISADGKLQVKSNRIMMRWDERSELVSEQGDQKRKKREEWEQTWRAVETLLLPESIGDSEPRARRLPASLHSTRKGRKRRAELINKTAGRYKELKQPSFLKKKQHRNRICFQLCFRTSPCPSGKPFSPSRF